jgi:hypothetical protein
METLFDLEPSLTAERPALPPLSGTPKQLPWAAAVRCRLLTEVERLLKDSRDYLLALERSGRTEVLARERANLQAARDASERLARETSCQFWLDRRDLSARELLAGAPARPGSTYGRPDPPR